MVSAPIRAGPITVGAKDVTYSITTMTCVAATPECANRLQVSAMWGVSSLMMMIADAVGTQRGLSVEAGPLFAWQRMRNVYSWITCQERIQAS